MNNICIIPARGGSKRIPHKNIKLFNGAPIIKWVINSAIKSNCFKNIYVSTDSHEIARIAKKNGAKVPFIRPNNLADDHTSTLDVIKHAIIKLKNQGIIINNVCCLYATAPLVQISDLIEGNNLIENSLNKRFVFSASYYEYPIQRALFLDKNNYSKMIESKFINARSQDLNNAFHDAGQFYWGSSETWLNESNILEGSIPLFIPRWRVQDIDNLDDWNRAEIIHKILADKD